MSATRNRRAALPGTRGLLPSLFSGVPHSSKGASVFPKARPPSIFPPICERVMVPAASPVILLFAEINRRRNEHQGTFVSTGQFLSLPVSNGIFRPNGGTAQGAHSGWD
jgi:hypothetical protein